MLIEFWQDLFEAKPLEKHRQDDGEIQFTNTGDPLIDKWEEQIARGEMPDMMEAFDTVEGRKAIKRLQDAKSDRAPMSMLDVARKIEELQRKNEGSYDPRLVQPPPEAHKRRTF